MQRQSVREQIHADKLQDSNNCSSNSSQAQSLLKHVHSRPGQQMILNQKQTEQIQRTDHVFQGSSEENYPLTQLYAKLNSETDRILKWKVSAELELAQKERKLTETQDVMERQRKNLFELQMHSEQLTHRLQIELKNREELTSKIDNTRKICNIVRDHCNQLTCTLNLCVEEKENLKSVYSDQFKEIEDISEKFRSAEKEFKNEIDQLEEMVTEERNQRNKIINEANALHSILNDKLEEMDKKIHSETEKVAGLEQQLFLSSEKVKSLAKEKSEVANELSLSKSRYNELENQMSAQRRKYEKDMTELSTLLKEERERQDLLKHQYAEAQEKLSELEKIKISIATENSSLTDSLRKLETINEKNNEEMRKMNEDYTHLLKEKDELLLEVKQIEELKTNLKRIEMDYEGVTLDRQMMRKELDTANKKIDTLESNVKTNEETILEYTKEKERLKDEIDSLKNDTETLNKKMSSALALEDDLKQKILHLKEEIQKERNQAQYLQSKLDMDTSALVTLLEKGKSDMEIKVLELKTLTDEANNSKKIIDDLQNQQKAYIVQINDLEKENESLKKSLVCEQEKIEYLNEQLKVECGSKDELNKDLEDLKMKSKSTTELIEKIKCENLALEEKLNNLHLELSKVSEEKNNYYTKYTALEKETEAIQNKSDSEIKEMVAILEKYKRECDEIVNQKEAKISTLLADLDGIKKQKEHLMEMLNEIKQDNISYQRKTLDLEKEKDIMEKTLQVKMMDLELKLTAKDKEIAEKEVALLKSDSNIGEKIFSTPSRKMSPKIEGRKLCPQTPKTSKSPSQSQKLYQTPGTPLRKEPNTPGGNKKQVTFQEDTSDTDASSVDAMILDNADLITRFEALERGVKMMTPIRVLPSPKNRKKKMEKQFKDIDKNSEFMMKKARMNKQDFEEPSRKNLSGILKPLRQFNDEGKNTGLDLDELFEMVED